MRLILIDSRVANRKTAYTLGPLHAINYVVTCYMRIKSRGPAFD